MRAILDNLDDVLWHISHAQVLLGAADLDEKGERSAALEIAISSRLDQARARVEAAHKEILAASNAEAAKALPTVANKVVRRPKRKAVTK